VLEEAVDEVVGGQSELAEAAAVMAIAIGEGGVAVGDRGESTVGDSHAVGVAGEVVEDGRGPAERGLCIDDPLLPRQGGEER
jgi:hypothetical protein